MYTGCMQPCASEAGSTGSTGCGPAWQAESGLDLGSAFHAYSLAALLEVRDTVWPIGVHLATLFGFQAAQPASTAPDAPAVPSNLDNQVDHLSKLIKNTMDRDEHHGTGYLSAFQAAVGAVHGQVRGSSIGLQPLVHRVAASGA